MTKEELNFIGSMNMCDEISNEAYKKIVNHVEETEISDDCVSLEVYKQVTRERDIAIEQLKELGYEFGEKIRTSDDCVSRAEILEEMTRREKNGDRITLGYIKKLPPVTPTHGTCKDCKHWKDSDGVYRRGIGAESKCPINNSRVYEGTFYCADFEK